MTSEPPVPPAPDGAQPGTGGVATPGNGDPETAAIAITYLQAQLSQATAAFDSLDQKATLLPLFLIGAAVLLVPAGDVPFGLAQVALLTPSLVTGGLAVYHAYEALRTRKVQAGPDPKEVAAKMGHPVAPFSAAIAGEIAAAIEARRDALSDKAKAFNKAMKWAAVTLALILLARLIGGFIVANSDEAQPSPAPTAPASATPAAPSETPASAAPPPSASPTPTPTPPATPAPTPTEAPASPSAAPTTTGANAAPMFETTSYLEFGQSWEQKGVTEPGPSESRKMVESPEPPAADKSERSDPA